jgi:hypothetical protein
LPAKLADLPDIDPVFSIDGWKTPIQYAPQPDGSVILTSHGAVGTNQIFSIQFAVPGITSKAPTSAVTNPSDTNKGP